MRSSVETSDYRTSDMIERLATSIHEEWRRGDWPKRPHLDVPFAELAPADKEDNRAAARRIPDVFAVVGLGVATPEEAKSLKKPTIEELARYFDAHIERLAEAEHNGWMDQRVRNGWTYGVPRDDARKVHPLIKPYSALPDAEKQKDRSAVRHYAAQVRAAGLEIVWL